MKFILNIIFWIKDRIDDLIEWIGGSARNFRFFLYALPTFFGLYLGLVFVGSFTGLTDKYQLRGATDTDKNYNLVQNDDVLYLEQGWQDRYRSRYYFTPQGSHILPLDIALGLEMPESQRMIFGKNGTSETDFGYLPHPQTLVKIGTKYEKTYFLTGQTPTVEFLNSIGLPIGFTIDGTPENPMLGINCAACHTSNITHNGKTIRVEGGAALGDFMGLFGAIDDSLLETAKNPAKKRRLAERLGVDMSNDQSRNAFEQKLELTLSKRQAWQRRNSDSIPEDNPHGHGRVDAFGVIFNQVLGRDLNQDKLAPPDEDLDAPAGHHAFFEGFGDFGNVRVPDAPVSYPVLWDTPFMGRVQWNGSANNVSQGGVLGRNTGQVLGVFGDVDVTENSHLPGYCSTVKRRNLQLFDHWIKALKSPKWEDAAAMGALPPIDTVKAETGKHIYQGTGAYEGRKNCASCHSVPDQDFRDKYYKDKNTCDLKFTMVASEEIGTDPNTAKAGIRTGAFSGPLAGQSFKRDPEKTIGAREDKVTLLREVVAGSIAGSFQPVTCQGEIGLGSLTEAASGFGKLARGRWLKSTKSGSTYVGEHISGGYETKAVGRDDECANTEIIRMPDANEPSDDPLLLTYSADAYRARPLTGIWASAPYLHNGSIPTLYDLLSPPAEADGSCRFVHCRPTAFNVGSTNFDAVNVGFKDEAGVHTTKIDTSLSGNKNTGHEKMINLSEEERMALIEYLKTL
ncbi:MAG: di-heme-cytochrome C peroxidase [Litorimonas sp.]